MNLYIITGASSGLGKAMHDILNINKNITIDISRKSKSHPCDLSKLSTIPSIVGQIFSTYNQHNFNSLTLINNAGVVKPISPLGAFKNNHEIISSINLNLTAPVLLSNEFLKQTSDYKGELKIVNISSGVAKRPKAYWAPYSAAKAGLENFSECLAQEQENRCKVFCLDPGLIDTDMQKNIRNTNKEDFPGVSRFKDFKEQGYLSSPIDVAQRLLEKAGLT